MDALQGVQHRAGAGRKPFVLEQLEAAYRERQAAREERKARGGNNQQENTVYVRGPDYDIQRPSHGDNDSEQGTLVPYLYAWEHEFLRYMGKDKAWQREQPHDQLYFDWKIYQLKCKFGELD